MPLTVDPTRPAGSLRALDQPRLTGDRLVLRPWQDADAAAVLAAFSCPDIQWWHIRRMDTLDEAREWIADWATRWDGEKDSSWAVVDDTGRVVGQVGLRAVSLFEGSAALSYWVLPEARGAEVAVRAARTLTRWVFDVLRLHRVALEHSTANAASCRVATKLGFAVEDTLRGSARQADGWHDMHQHALLRTDG
ncbi:GNAT family N-acetyltransferase [Lentzea guizhouensis]|uniref:GNAT family N-acetyltransferase n=1 Tax=Lentzea guizhouensis TaxID=1586287 RepID=A0A1B2HG32_9PSEU|nr:GNAT family N-acetyltransferase [Lentzea guizhouensis]ANZ36676.1 GNAT family N-acetyltransferase [Lentzea guizhouensis]